MQVRSLKTKEWASFCECPNYLEFWHFSKFNLKSHNTLLLSFPLLLSNHLIAVELMQRLLRTSTLTFPTPKHGQNQFAPKPCKSGMRKENFQNFSQENCEKCINLEYFSKNLTNSAFNFCGFGRKALFAGNVWDNFLKFSNIFLRKLRKMHYFSIFYK